MNNWIVFKGKKSGIIHTKITTEGYMAGEIQETIKLLKQEKAEDITAYLEVELESLNKCDFWSRPMYKDCDGSIYVDINCGEGNIDIHTYNVEWEEPVSSIEHFTIVEQCQQIEKT